MCCYNSRGKEPVISEKVTDESSTMHPTVASIVTGVQNIGLIFKLLYKRDSKRKYETSYTQESVLRNWCVQLQLEFIVMVSEFNLFCLK